MKADRRRLWIYILLFLLTMINYMDRINLSIAAAPIQKAFHLSPIVMGYVFSSFLWTYIICLVPVGLAVDKWGTRIMASVSISLWSIAGILTGASVNFMTLLLSRLGLGAGESASYLVGARALREWAPRSERGLATAILNGGAYAGPAFGAIFVAWLVTVVGWRYSFVVTGAIGLVWMIVWLIWFRLPEKVTWLSESERNKILQERDAGAPTVAKVNIAQALKVLLRSKTLWALAITQGCANYTSYLFLTWLPGYLQTSRGLNMLKSGFYTAAPYAIAVVLGLILGWISDRLLKGKDLTKGGRRNVVAVSLLFSSVVLFTPFVSSIWVVLALITVSLASISTALSMNTALTSDLLHDAKLTGVTISILFLGGNIFGALAPIITGYVVAGSSGFTGAFIIAGVLLLIGATVCMTLTRKSIDAPLSNE
ncbi:MFS transporter [Paenibacillus filicis]|uniref:MFS transporter n=1 Tax=Paenibacillus gyeongsangnamensis TaxID=3388067 RepID=A0ABT4QIC2_9BACL|nr:MFS transporter [Paenibacillus filicis]MCZ8516614.1 MFS transporter [Paenibacillus filicis]